MKLDGIVMHLVLIWLSLFGLIALSGIFFRASAKEAEKDAYDLWSVGPSLKSSRDCYDYLSEEGWLDPDTVSFDDFDRIFVMTDQFVREYKNVDAPLILAMVAHESRFDKNAGSEGGARGLMQLLPIYQQNRMEQFVEEGHQVDLDDFMDPRLNLITGIDYISYILTETDGVQDYALMWYNQGAVSASRDYLDDHHISDYAQSVQILANRLRDLIPEQNYN